MKLSLFSVSFAGLWGQATLSLDDVITTAANLGFDGVEIMGKRPHLSPLDVTMADCARYKRLMDQHGISCACVAAYTDFTGLEGRGIPATEMQIEYVTELARRAAALGSNLVRVFTSFENPALSWTSQWCGTVEAIRECADRARDLGVDIGIQNHHDVGVETSALAELIRQIDRSNVRPMWDCWSVHLRGEDISDAVELVPGAVPLTTVADYVCIPRFKYNPQIVNYEALTPAAVQAVPMGEGDLDYETFFKVLKERQFDGWVSYEMCSTLRDGGSLVTLERYAKQFVRYMRGLPGYK